MAATVPDITFAVDGIPAGRKQRHGIKGLRFQCLFLFSEKFLPQEIPAKFPLRLIGPNGVVSPLLDQSLTIGKGLTTIRLDKHDLFPRVGGTAVSTKPEHS